MSCKFISSILCDRDPLKHNNIDRINEKLIFVLIQDTTIDLFMFRLIEISSATTPHKSIETNSRYTTKIDISSHMESVNFQSGNDETAKNREVARGLGSRLPSR